MNKGISPEQENLISPEMEERHHLVVGIHGGVGVGKTKLAELMGKRCGLRRLEEDYRENPYLGKFYDNPAKWSYLSQSFFIKDAFKLMTQMSKNEPMVLDPTYYQHKEIYAWVQYHRMNWMEDWQYQAYLCLCEKLETIGTMPRPDIIVSVHAPIEIILRRIRRRAEEENREFELKMLAEKPEYFEWMAHRVEQWARENSHNLPIIEVDSHEYDYVADPADAFEVINHIQEEVDTYLGGREDIVLPYTFAQLPGKSLLEGVG
ncbi:MAG: deoxynucleoside kinase [Candidatus Marinimicrobia bacterium]|nr:deoxynucleoside kinase [Candidatus Neomarinimicrobiota bacterium]